MAVGQLGQMPNGQSGVKTAMQEKFLFRLFWVTLALAFLLLLAHFLPLLESALAPDDAPRRAVTARGELAADEQSTIELFEKAKDSVVFITTRQQVMDFWTRNVFSAPRGTGSGFIWDEAGNVVTNYHVVEGASEAWVKLSDGRDYRAALVGASPMHDIAVLRIGVGFKRPPPVPIGTSADLKVGQKVFAIGNPFGPAAATNVNISSLSAKPWDFNIITATNIDLDEAVKNKLFRKDLFYRLAIMTVKVPRLAERREDILVLFEHFMRLALRGLADARLDLGAPLLARG